MAGADHARQEEVPMPKDGLCRSCGAECDGPSYCRCEPWCRAGEAEGDGPHQPRVITRVEPYMLSLEPHGMGPVEVVGEVEDR
jgi:hypothetical protein